MRKTRPIAEGHYILHLACNDDRSGRFQDTVDAIEVHQGTDCLLSLERYGEPLFCHIAPVGLTIGSVTIPYTVHGSWVGNWCWETFTITSNHLQEVLRLLAATHWQLSEADEDGLRLWNTVTQ
jgi:hypothetical protein